MKTRMLAAVALAAALVVGATTMAQFGGGGYSGMGGGVGASVRFIKAGDWLIRADRIDCVQLNNARGGGAAVYLAGSEHPITLDGPAAAQLTQALAVDGSPQLNLWHESDPRPSQGRPEPAIIDKPKGHAEAPEPAKEAIREPAIDAAPLEPPPTEKLFLDADPVLEQEQPKGNF